MQAKSGIERDGHHGRTPYRKHALSDKRRIVELCLTPGASVAGIALAHGVNANLVRKWIAKYRAGEYGQTAVSLLPVSVRPDTVLKSVTAAAVSPKGHIEIDLPGARVCLQGRVDADTLRLVLENLTR